MADDTEPRRASYGPVIALIVFTYVIATSVTERVGIAIVLVVQIGTVWYVLRVAAIGRHLHHVATAVFAVAVVAGVWGVFSPGNWLLGATFLAGCVLYLIAPGAMVADVARRAVDKELLLGALAAY
ncbi:hypothetical protein [Paractinoplanes maris]|uniref:hypothetical protein n=1 Tax=Paractinoplanes maris TaxID=1734446 RepID=UPI00202141E2|nr:hypothetical protein [Actinoplanes maris]